MSTKPQSTTEPALEPCPFCGASAFISWDGDVNSPDDWSANCDNTLDCGAKVGGMCSEDAARKAWNTRISPASAAPVVDESAQKMFPPPAEDKLHIAICNAVQSERFTASDILRQALLDYQPTQLTRTELIRIQQRSGSGEVSVIMVSPAAATAAPVEQKQPLPDHYLCVAPDEQLAVINFLRGYGTDADRELAQLHLNLCLRCQELANAAPAEQYYCPEHRYNPQPNSGLAFCPKCETEALDRSKAARAAAEEIYALQKRYGHQTDEAVWMPTEFEITGIIEHHCFPGVAESVERETQ